MTSAYTAGELQAFAYALESAYGTIPTGALSWGGDTLNLKPAINYRKRFDALPASRSLVSCGLDGIYEIGFNLRYLERVGSSWWDFFTLYGWGAAKALADHLSSFTMSCDVLQGATHAYQVYNGCKVNRATIHAPGPGQPLEFEIDAFAQWFQIASSKNLTGLQTVTVAADPSAETGARLKWAGNATLSLAGGGAETVYLKDWKLVVIQGIERDPGNKLGADSAYYPVAIGMHEGVRDIYFEGSILSQSQTYANSKKSDDAITALTLPIDDETITLANGWWVPDTMPEYSQGINYETLKMRFPTVAAA